MKEAAVKGAKVKRKDTFQQVTIVRKDTLRGKKLLKHSVRKMMNASRLLHGLNRAPGPPGSSTSLAAAADGFRDSSRKKKASISSAVPHLGHSSKQHRSRDRSVERLSITMAQSLKGSAEAARRSSRKKKGDRHAIKLHRAFRVLDVDHSGEIDFEEFIEVCESQDRVAVLKLFELIDEDHGGSINENELVHALQHNKEARTLAAQFPPLQNLVGMTREERRERARSRRKASKRKSGMRRRQSKRKLRQKARPPKPPAEVDDLTVGDEGTMSTALQDVREQQRQRTQEMIKEKKQNETTDAAE